MKTTEPLKQIVQIEAARAANHDFAGVVPVTPTAKQQSSGWDPIEVWRRMINEPRLRRAKEQQETA